MLAEYLDELEFLARTAHAETICTFTQSLDHPDVRTFVGKGKFQEITEYIEEHDIDLLIFDDELSPSQLRNLGEALPETKVLDRANLILDIFAQRARTAHAKTQVELAQYQYLLPRLTNMWTHLQKQKGGIGMKGPGEKEIETDRRIIRDRICGPQEGFGAIDRQMATQRGNRGALVRVALVGYTNAGKSTLMNRLAKSEVFAEDKLFRHPRHHGAQGGRCTTCPSCSATPSASSASSPTSSSRASRAPSMRPERATCWSTLSTCRIRSLKTSCVWSKKPSLASGQAHSGPCCCSIKSTS